MTENELALLIFGAGEIQFGEFNFKIHETFPEAPKSPIKIVLRQPPQGKLSLEILHSIGRYLYKTVQQPLSWLSYDCIVGLPRAGEPLAQGFWDASMKKPIILRLEKEEQENHRQILPVVSGDFKIGQKVLMIDDVITNAGT